MPKAVKNEEDHKVLKAASDEQDHGLQKTVDDGEDQGLTFSSQWLYFQPGV